MRRSRPTLWPSATLAGTALVSVGLGITNEFGGTWQPRRSAHLNRFVTLSPRGLTGTPVAVSPGSTGHGDWFKCRKNCRHVAMRWSTAVS